MMTDPDELAALRARFERYPLRVTESGCHVWTGSMSANGYGQIEVRVEGRRRGWLAHRAAWVLDGRDLPENLHHRCHVKLCVRLDHLDALSTAEHTSHHNGEVEACVNGHEFTQETTYRRPDTGARQCRRCKADRERARRKARAV